MNKYHKLFSVTCNHEYYADGLTRDLIFRPTPETQKRLQQLGLLVKPMNGGLQVFYASSEGIPHPLEMLTKPGSFSFTIQVSNPLFYKLTDLPVSKDSNAGHQDHAFHFQNRNARKSENTLVLHQGDYPGEIDLLPVWSMGFDYRWETGEQPKSLKVENEVGDSVFEQAITDPNISGLPISLNNEPSGKFNLIRDGKTEETFLTIPISPQSCFGLLQIHIGDQAAPGFELIHNGKISPKDYTISFAAPKSYWRYYFLIKNIDLNTKPEIYKGNEKADFLEAEEVTFSDGTRGYMMKSQKAIPSKQIPAESLQLHLKATDGNRDFKINLPNPTPDMLKTETKDGEAISISEIYVYL